MAKKDVEELLSQTVKGYREKENWEARWVILSLVTSDTSSLVSELVMLVLPVRLSKARSCFTETELTPLTELFLQLAQETTGYTRSTPIEFIKIPSVSMLKALVTIRGRNVGLKEFAGDSSSLEVLSNTTENILKIWKPHRKPGSSLPVDYCQYLLVMECLRTGDVSCANISKIFSIYTKNSSREAEKSPERHRGQNGISSSCGIESCGEDRESRRLLTKNQETVFRCMERLFKIREVFFRRLEDKSISEGDDLGLQCECYVMITLTHLMVSWD